MKTVVFGKTEKLMVGAASLLAAATLLLTNLSEFERATCSTFSVLCSPEPTSSPSARQLDLRFTLAFADPNNPLYDPSAIYIGEKFTSAQDYYVVPDRRVSPPIYVWPHVLMPSRQRPYSAILRRVVRDANQGTPIGLSTGTEICLVDGASPPATSNPFAVLECDEAAGQCKLKKPDDPGWVNFCMPKQAAFSLPGLISSARADEAGAKVWNVPSLETLRGRKDLRGVGYTRFEITAPSLPGEKIDGVVLGLKVNGTAVLIDGVNPEYRTLAYDPSRGLKVEFALQNLDFAGVYSGCDTISASLQPVSKGKIAGPAIVLQRPYVAMRDAEPVNVRAAEREFAWTGTYVRPQDAYEYEVLINSVPLSNLESKQQLDNARQSVNAAKQQVDRMTLTFQGMRVVGVVRPPLSQSKPAFGTALGVIAPTGQIQFAFDKDTATQFKASVVADAARIPRASEVVRKDTLVYPFNKDVDPPKGICAMPDQ